MVITPFATVVIALIIVIVSALSLSLSYFGNSRRRASASKLPPGDSWSWPLIGSTFSFFKPHSSNTRAEFLDQQLSRHGKIFSTRFLGEVIVVSADPELNRFIVLNEMKLFKNNLPSQIRTLLGDANLSFMEEEEYRQKKSVVLSFFNSWGIQTTFFETVDRAAARVINSWRHKDVIYVSDEANKYAFNLILEKAMGIASDDPQTEQLRREFNTLHNGFYAIPLNLPFTGYRKALKARGNIIKVIKNILEKRKMDGTEIDGNDMIGVFLKDNPNIPVQNFCDGIIGFIIAGLFNTPISISLAIYFLGKHPEAIPQMREEYLRSKDGKDKLTWDDYKNMEFSQNVLNETLRVGNVVPGLWRKALKDIEFKGYVIPEGTTVMAHISAMHLDSSAFDKPENFDPWRWLNIKKTNNWMPFGGGVRYCNGSEIARIQIILFLHHLIHNYDWDFVEIDQPISLPLVIFPKGLPISVRPFDSSLI